MNKMILFQDDRVSREYLMYIGNNTVRHEKYIYSPSKKRYESFDTYTFNINKSWYDYVKELTDNKPSWKIKEL